MRTVIISYSLTGNNKALAASIADELAADHLEVVEKRHRTTQTILMDLFFQRIPAVHPRPEEMDKYERVIFMGPIWMGVVATPLRAYLNT